MKCHRSVVTAAVALLLSAGGAGSQIVRFDPRGAQVGAGYQGVWQEIATGATFRSQYYREWVELPFTGMLLSPRIFHYTLRLSPYFSQQSASGLDDSFTTRSLSVNFSGMLLQAGRTPITLTATRNSGNWRGGLTADRNFSERYAQASLWFNNRWLPLRVAVDQRSGESTWRTDGEAPIRQSEFARGFLATASNTKLTLQFEHRSLEDRIVQQTYTMDTRTAAHTLQWGKGSRMASSLESVSRGGFGSFDRTAWSEHVHIQHTQSASSNVGYSSRRSKANGSSFREHTWTANSEAGFRWLRLSASGDASTVRFRGGRRTQRSFVPTAVMNVSLPLGGLIRVTGFSGIEALDIEADETDLIGVLDERHDVPELRSFFLDNRFVDPATVVVRSEDQTTTYILDRDYRLIEAGSLLRLVVPAGSRIQAGDVLLVSYQYRLIGEGRQRSRRAGYSVLVRLAGFSVHRSEQQRRLDADEEEGTRGFFDTYDATTAASFTESTPIGRFLVEASRAKRIGPAFSDVTDELRANHSSVIGGVVRTDLTASGSRARSGDEEISAFYGSGGLGIRFSSNLGLSARVDAWRFERNSDLVEATVVGSLNLDWRFGSTETDWRFEHIRRENGSIGTENRFTARVVRRF